MPGVRGEAAVKAADHIALDMFIGSFSARQDAYVYKSRWHKHEPLTPQVAFDAFKDGASISGYMADANGMTHVGAIDFDLEGEQEARDVRAFLDEQGIQSLLVESRRGAHLWVQTIGDGKNGSQPFGMVPAPIMRRALHAAVHLCMTTESLRAHDMDESELDQKVEVFPKKSNADWGVGALRMPLFPHPKTGVRYPAHDPFDDAEVTNIIPLLNLMADLQRETPYNALYRLAGEDTAPVSYPRGTGLERPAYAGTGDVPKVTDLLSTHYGVGAKPGHSVRCPFHDDKKASLSVSQDEERVWCKSPSCIAYNNGVGMGSIDMAEYLRKEPPIATGPE